MCVNMLNSYKSYFSSILIMLLSLYEEGFQWQKD